MTESRTTATTSAREAERRERTLIEDYITGLRRTDPLADDIRKDLDETRRLLYMALVAGRTKRYNLVGTIVNAIKHHQRQDVDTDELIEQLVAAVDEPLGTEWVRDQINRITDELGD